MNTIFKYQPTTYTPTLPTIPEEIGTSPVDWTQMSIQGDQISLKPITNYQSEDFRVVCMNLFEDNDDVELQELTIWSIAFMCDLYDIQYWSVHDRFDQPIGALSLTPRSYDQLIEELNNVELVNKLFSQEKWLEIGYSLNKESRGMGVGTDMLKTFVNHAKKYGQANHLFATVNNDNNASICLLKKTGFRNLGSFFHQESQKETSVYSL